MSTFPSVLTSYTNPTPTSPLNAPSHSGVENAQNSGLQQLEATVGLAGSSSALGTVIGDLRSPASNGGGHVQSANTGGTGQTSYNKGDILVASSSSVLSKIAVGADNTVLKADSSQTSGVSWSNAAAAKVAVKTSIVSIAGGMSSVANVLFSASIIGSTLGTGNAVRFKGIIDNFSSPGGGGGTTINLNLQYGNQSVAGITVLPVSSVSGMKGVIEGFIVSGGTANSQNGSIEMRLANNNVGAATAGLVTQQLGTSYAYGSSTVDSGAGNALIVTFQSNGGATASILGTIFVVDKIT